MTSWNRRMTAVDRRLSRHATVADQPRDAAEPTPGPAAAGAGGPAPVGPASIRSAAPSGPAARLAELLRADQLGGHGPTVVLAGTA
jgi:hypothetical protein